MRNEELTYRDNVKQKLETMDGRMNRFEIDVRESLSRIETQVSFTNGKVRKITMALILLGGIMIGMNFSTWHDIISLISNLK